MVQLKNTIIIAAAIAVVVLAVSPAGACDTPVFQYALERWQPHPVPVVVFHRGALTGDAAAAADLLGKAGEDGEANVELHMVDLDKSMPDYHKEFWEKNKSQQLPHLFVLTPPRAAGNVVLWHGPLSPQAAKETLESPARGEVAKRILDGDSAVWVLVDGSDEAANVAAEKLLKQVLTAAPKLLEEAAANAPDIQPLPGPPGQEELVEEYNEVKFSVLRVSRKDPAERLFIDMMLRVEPGLTDKKYDGKPMVFPIFGRGRALSALVGAGISRDNILRECGFMSGPCACEIKDQNPGIDILFAAPWDNAIAGAQAVQFVLPPLPDAAAPSSTDAVRPPTGATSTTDVPKPVAAPTNPMSQIPPVAHEEGRLPGWSFLLIALVALAGLVVIVVGVSIAIAAKRKNGG